MSIPRNRKSWEPGPFTGARVSGTATLLPSGGLQPFHRVPRAALLQLRRIHMPWRQQHRGGGSFCGCSVFNLNGVSFYVLCREKLLHEFYGQVTPLSHRYHSWVSVLSSSPSSSSMADKIHIFCKLALANCRMVLSLISRNFSDLIPPFSFLREFSKFPDTYLLRSRPFRNFTREAALYLSPSRNIFFLKFGLKILQIGENLVLEKWHFLVGRLIWT